MRRIEHTTAFRRDYKREKKGQLKKQLDGLLGDLIALLAADAVLPAAASDHPLSGEWNDHRDCHVRPDLVLIYRKVGNGVLQLVRLGSHSQLFD
jgi:mRNA interferase YafQ